MNTCRSCNHDCHCNTGNHIDEYLDYCPCQDCDCGQNEEDKTYEGKN